MHREPGALQGTTTPIVPHTKGLRLLQESSRFSLATRLRNEPGRSLTAPNAGGKASPAPPFNRYSALARMPTAFFSLCARADMRGSHLRPAYYACALSRLLRRMRSAAGPRPTLAPRPHALRSLASTKLGWEGRGGALPSYWLPGFGRGQRLAGAAAAGVGCLGTVKRRLSEWFPVSRRFPTRRHHDGLAPRARAQ